MLHKQPKSKDILYGIHPAMEAIRAHKSVERILLQKGIHGENFKGLFQLIRDENIPFQYVPQEKLNHFTRGNHQGVVCLISPIDYESIYDIVPFLYEQGKTPFLLFLDRITDVRNIGAIARTAYCAGVDAIVIPSKNSARLNEDAVKSSAGALHKIPVCRHDNPKEVLEYLKQSGIQLLACTEKAQRPYYAESYRDPLCILMGSEGEGIEPAHLALCDKQIAIPMVGDLESLNVSVATGIVLFEVLRQRQQ
ncbi:MAG: 23S rRNA (guanosine(2251)-2'-O)-methyltransferase RlmB [Bacteroidales bacterium]|nr:23S rRNA (guanosine(2251)-2'-O)-methyltransferase RlmB [Bacteroidales bacterium]